ncbi:MAG: hypothetical protein ABI549_01260 [Flavobacterium sp.]|uniref:hypothetical protein n=1 Tax=Flavobacterium sp. TaxID=239 RepID=UPI0032643A70
MKFKYIIILVSTILLFSFQQKKNDTIKGIWTNKSTENATFKINNKTIYYVDDFTTYKYTYSNNTIKIYYSDYIYEAKVTFSKGIMTLKSSDGSISKFWRFKG